MSTININKKLKKELKIEATKQDTTIKELVERVLGEYVNEMRKD